ncbi:hypothetical protein RZQ20_29100 [Raoultella ornithinolytica]|uniref:hypothetical protein n=1 Tax=Raoultella ornithinolytica TaxID=54291 RepID=UPI00255AFD6F|nr:hypothetical protein [Raoultella ornithinolytica]MDL4585372.1 hypothetical protein [Raoultella ornithinolytica]MDV1096287.1 hypothetical protein [Raoultella ornithinolytica]MDV1124123.1 hypothetical protein [Raoultella ornithinolytica]MDV1894444.1 hypothetical protein [Raoultella ornithinolytica]HEC2564935.1 hypothetical protein [Raoultella ornithinolytica]
MEEIVQQIKEEIKSNWAKKKRPLLLSTLGDKFKNIKQEKDFKGIKEWVEKHSVELDAYIYKDAIKPEYIGLVPNGEEFESKSSSTLSAIKKNERIDKKKATLEFLTILNNLEDEDLRRITIPTDILVRLLK